MSPAPVSITDSDDPYRWMHDQVRKARGKASRYRCWCGGQAEEWALVPDPVGTLSVVQHEGKAMWFSDFIGDYRAACVVDHRAADALLRREFEASWERVLDPPSYNDGDLMAWE